MASMLPGAPQLVRGLPTSTKMGNELKRRLYVNGYVTTVAVVLHVAITIIIFIMGYSTSQNNYIPTFSNIPACTSTGAGTYSVTVVVCAFGALETCVFVLTSAYQCFQKSSKVELPHWEWLNDSFVTNVAACAFLVFFLWPALVVFTIHEQGEQFFSMMNCIQQTDTALYSKLTLHITSAVLMLAVDLLLIGTSTLKLVILQAPRRDLDEDDIMNSPGKVTRNHVRNLSMQRGINDPPNIPLSPSNNNNNHLSPPSPHSVRSNSTDVVVGPNSTEIQVVNEQDLSQPITGVDYFLFLFALGANILYFANLIKMSSTTLSAGTVAPTVIFGLLLVIWLGTMFYFRFVERINSLSEDWLVNFRLYSSFHFAATFCFFYMGLLVVILSQRYNIDFIIALNRMETGKAIMCWLLLICFALIVMVYAVISYYYSRIMWQLDEIASLRLLERTRIDRITNKKGSL